MPAVLVTIQTLSCSTLAVLFDQLEHCHQQATGRRCMACKTGDILFFFPQGWGIPIAQDHCHVEYGFIGSRDIEFWQQFAGRCGNVALLSDQLNRFGARTQMRLLTSGTSMFVNAPSERTHGMAPRLPQSTVCPSSTTVARNLSQQPCLRSSARGQGQSAASGPDEHLPMGATHVLIMSSAG